jgi:hypothetical protein
MHCLPILLQSDPERAVSCRFNKYTERCLPPDVTFLADSYASFQFVQYHFTRPVFLASIRAKLDGWSRAHFGIAANIETCRGSARRFVRKIVATRPSQRIPNTTHLFALFPDTNEFVGLLDHYYCDGLILFDLFARLFDQLGAHKPPFPTYGYYPPISDALACELTTRLAWDTLRFPAHATPYGHARIFRRILHRRDAPGWNRWSNYAMSVRAAGV